MTIHQRNYHHSAYQGSPELRLHDLRQTLENTPDIPFRDHRPNVAVTEAFFPNAERQHAPDVSKARLVDFPLVIEHLGRLNRIIGPVTPAVFASNTEDHFLDGSETENAVWKDISALERELRSMIRKKYTGIWLHSADSTIARLLGNESMATVARDREKYLKQYKYSAAPHGEEILDSLYLGQLSQLIKAGDAWALFKDAFRDKRHLEDLISAIIPVRNDAAHFRSVPKNELDRCRIAVNDLRAALGKLSLHVASGKASYRFPLQIQISRNVGRRHL